MAAIRIPKRAEPQKQQGVRNRRQSGDNPLAKLGIRRDTELMEEPEQFQPKRPDVFKRNWRMDA